MDYAAEIEVCTDTRTIPSSLWMSKLHRQLPPYTCPSLDNSRRTGQTCPSILRRPSRQCPVLQYTQTILDNPGTSNHPQPLCRSITVHRGHLDHLGQSGIRSDKAVIRKRAKMHFYQWNCNNSSNLRLNNNKQLSYDITTCMTLFKTFLHGVLKSLGNWLANILGNFTRGCQIPGVPL